MNPAPDPAAGEAPEAPARALPTAADLARETIAAYADRLLPERAGTLADVLARGGGSRAQMAAAVERLLASPESARVYGNAEAPPVDPAKSPLRLAVERQVAAGRVRPESAEGLVARLATRGQGLDAPRAAALVAAELDRPRSADVLVVPRADPRAAVVELAIAEGFPEIPAAARSALAASMGPRWAASDPLERRRAIARELSSPIVAARLGIEPLARDDPRRGGRYAPPEGGPRRSLIN